MTTRDLVRIALFAAVIGALGLLPKFDIPLAGGVPITAQTLGVMLAGVVLGPRNGAIAVLLFLFVVALGAPLLAGGRGGLGVFYGPSAGFLIGFVPGAFIAGWVAARLEEIPVTLAALAGSIIGGILVVYACGIPVLAWKANMEMGHAATAALLFLPGDVLKAVAAAFIAEAISRVSPRAVFGR